MLCQGLGLGRAMRDLCLSGVGPPLGTGSRILLGSELGGLALERGFQLGQLRAQRLEGSLLLCGALGLRALPRGAGLGAACAAFAATVVSRGRRRSEFGGVL